MICKLTPMAWAQLIFSRSKFCPSWKPLMAMLHVKPSRPQQYVPSNLWVFKQMPWNVSSHCWEKQLGSPFNFLTFPNCCLHSTLVLLHPRPSFHIVFKLSLLFYNHLGEHDSESDYVNKTQVQLSSGQGLVVILGCEHQEALRQNGIFAFLIL